MPWNLRLGDRTTLAARCEIYNLGPVALGPRATIAQEAYLCAGTHDFEHPYTPLVTAPITIDEDVFVGARAFILPGVTIARGAIVGACAVVTRDVAELSIVAGNPARVIGARRWEFTDQLPVANSP
jgi:putative colanic acid biosynthesis acetyltransferase WcaF